MDAGPDSWLRQYHRCKCKKVRVSVSAVPYPSTIYFLSKSHCCGAVYISSGSGSTEPEIRIKTPAPAPTQTFLHPLDFFITDSFFRYLEKFGLDFLVQYFIQH